MSGGRVAIVRGPGLKAPVGVAPAASLRVCHLIGSLRCGGAERQVVNLLNHLPGSKNHLLLLEPPGPTSLIDDLAKDVEVALVPTRLRQLPMALVRLAKVLRDWRIDVLHTHMFWPSVYGVLAANLADVPVVLTSEHGKNLWKNAAHRWIERNLVTRGATLRLCASEDIIRLRHEREGIPATKLRYLPNGTMVPPPRQRRQQSPPLIGSVGRLVEAKDYSSLISAAALLRDRGVAFRLALVGDGPLRGTLQREISSNRLERRVCITGFQADVGAWLREFDIFVLPSLREGQPLALLEAMAYGLPVVASRVGGIPATAVDGKEALLLEPGDPVALADTLQSLLADRAVRAELGARARRRVEREFSIEAVASRCAHLYREQWELRAVANR